MGADLYGGILWCCIVPLPFLVKILSQLTSWVQHQINVIVLMDYCALTQGSSHKYLQSFDSYTSLKGSDAGTSSLWNLWSYWHTTPAPGAPVPASSCCYNRFGLPSCQGTWLLQSGSLDGGGSSSWCSDWCEFSFETPKYKPRCTFSQVVHSIGILPSTPALILKWIAGC